MFRRLTLKTLCQLYKCLIWILYYTYVIGIFKPPITQPVGVGGAENKGARLSFTCPGARKSWCAHKDYIASCNPYVASNQALLQLYYVCQNSYDHTNQI